MNKYKLSLIILFFSAVIILFVQLFYVFVLPQAINISERLLQIEKFAREQTNTNVKISNPHIKTFFDFSVEFKADKIDLYNSNNRNIFHGDNINIKIQPLALLFRQISLKNLEIDNLSVNVTRYNEKIFGLSDTLKFSLDKDSNFKINNSNININNYNIALEDRYVWKILSFSGKNIDINPVSNNLSAFFISGQMNSDKNISEYNLDFIADLSGKKDFVKNFLINGYINNINLKSFEKYLKNISCIETSEGIINLRFNSVSKNKNPNIINITADLNNIAINKGNLEKQLILNNDNLLTADINFGNNEININKSVFQGDDFKVISAGKIINYTEKQPKLDIAANILSAKAESVVDMLPYGVCKEINLIKKYGIYGDVNGSLIIKGDIFEPDIYGKITALNVHALRNSENTHTGTIKLDFNGKKSDITVDLKTKSNQTFNMTGIIDVYDKDWSYFRIKTSKKLELPLVRDILVPVSEIFDFLVVPLPVTKIKSGVGNAVLDIKGMKKSAYITGKVNLHNIDGNFDGIDANLTKVNVLLDFQYDKLNFYAPDFLVNSYKANLNGQCNLEKGNFAFALNSDNIASSMLYDIVKKSEWLTEVKNQMEQIGNISGFSDILLNVEGIINENFDFSKIDLNDFKINGFLNLKNNRIKLTSFSDFIERVSGKINFNNKGLSFYNTNFGIGKYSNGTATGNVKITSDNNSLTEISVKAPFMNFSDTINFILKSDFAGKDNFSLYNLNDFNAKHSLEFSGVIKNDEIDFKSVNAKIKFFGKTDEKCKNYISSGDINVKNNSAVIRNIKIKADKSDMLLNGIISNLHLKKPSYQLRVISKNFNVNSAADIIRTGIFGKIPSDNIKSCKDYQGAFDADIEVSNNGIIGQLNFKNFGFRHIVSDIPVLFPRLNVKFTNSKIILGKISGELGRTGKIPVFIDVVINNYMKIPYVNGKIMTRINQVFVERYINTKMQQPLKLTGNVDISAEINGSADSLRVTSNMAVPKESDISYLSANLGDTENLREFVIDAYMQPSNINLKKFEYIKYENNGNLKNSQTPMFTASGNFYGKSFEPKNFSFETKQNLSAKMLNFIFKKSLIKSGTFNAAVKYSSPQNINSDKITGIINIQNAEIPLYGALLKNTSVKMNGNNINIISSGNLIKTDYSVEANINNSLKLPVNVKNFVIHTKYLNLDNCIKTVNKWSIDAYLNSSVHSKVPFNISDVLIDRGNFKVDLIEFKSVPMTNLNSKISLDRDSNLKIKVDNFTMADGKVYSDIVYNIKNTQTSVNLKAEEVDSNIISEAFLGLKNQIKGKFSGNISLNTKGYDSFEQLENLNGKVNFSINDGKMPKLGSLEYLLHASNLIKTGFTALSVNGVAELLNPFKDGSFEKINGKFDIKKGVIKNLEILSQGSHLSIYVKGNYEIADSNANITVLGKFGRKINGILGGVGNISLNTFFNMIPMSKNSDEFNDEISKIPDVTYKSDDYRVFRADIEGNINENNAVKSFKWLK